MPDERLRLLFTCCHPALAPEARVALTLRTLGGLSTEAVARAFLRAGGHDGEAARAREAQDPRRADPVTACRRPRSGPRASQSVLAVVYLIFNEGYSATDASADERRALCEEAIRLARMLAALLPAEGEVHALLALVLLHDARRDARVGADGALVPLDEQDRARWRRDELREGLAALHRAARAAGAGRTRCRPRSPPRTPPRRAAPRRRGARSPRSTRSSRRCCPRPSCA